MRLLTLFSLILFSLSFSSLGQATYLNSFYNTTSLNVSVLSATGSSSGGNFMEVFVAYIPYSTTDTPIITDNNSGTYVTTVKTISVNNQAIYRAKVYNITGISSHTVTATFSTSHARALTVAAAVYSNVRTSSNPSDLSSSYNSVTGTGTPISPGSITPTSAPNLVILAATHSSSTINSSVSGYNTRLYVNTAGAFTLLIADQSQTSATATNPSISLTGSSNSSTCSIADFICNLVSTRCTTCDGWFIYH